MQRHDFIGLIGGAAAWPLEVPDGLLDLSGGLRSKLLLFRIFC
jgi:hypothetical protein